MPEQVALAKRAHALIVAPGHDATLAPLDPGGANRQAVAWHRLARRRHADVRAEVDPRRARFLTHRRVTFRRRVARPHDGFAG